MKCDAQQSLLSSALYARSDVEKGRGKHHAVLHDPNPARLLDDEQPRIAWRRHEIDRVSEPVAHLLEPQSV